MDNVITITYASGSFGGTYSEGTLKINLETLFDVDFRVPQFRKIVKLIREFSYLNRETENSIVAYIAAETSRLVAQDAEVVQKAKAKELLYGDEIGRLEQDTQQLERFCKACKVLQSA